MRSTNLFFHPKNGLEQTLEEEKEAAAAVGNERGGGEERD